MSVLRYLAIGLFLAIISCSSVKVYNLAEMPKYDMAEATENYDAISNAEQYHEKILYVYGILLSKELKPNPKESTDIVKGLDKYLYWISVARIQLFNGEYETSNTSANKALKGLEEVKNILIEIVKNHST